MIHAYGRIGEIWTIQTQHGDSRRRPVDERHMHRRSLPPERKQTQARLSKLLCCKLPSGNIDHGARPRPMLRYRLAPVDEIAQRRHIQITLSEKASHVLEPGDERCGEIYTCDQN
jgi:hypothetical protein